jgi:hypothetical protein
MVISKEGKNLMKYLAIIIPAFNEEKGLPELWMEFQK